MCSSCRCIGNRAPRIWIKVYVYHDVDNCAAVDMNVIYTKQICKRRCILLSSFNLVEQLFSYNMHGSSTFHLRYPTMQSVFVDPAVSDHNDSFIIQTSNFLIFLFICLLQVSVPCCNYNSDHLMKSKSILELLKRILKMEPFENFEI